MGKCSFVLIFIIFSSSVVGEDLIWRQNSNWGNPANWKENTLPCGGDVVSFEKTDSSFAVFVDAEVTVKKIVLPRNGRLVFGKEGRLAFSSSKTSCDGPKDGDSKTEKVFAPRTSFWDCPENWMKSDGTSPASAPCGDDVAVFPENNTFSFVSLSSTLSMVKVSGIKVRGTAVQDLSSFPDEFGNVSIVLDPGCSSKPKLCTCVKPGPLCQVPTASPVISSGVNGGVVAAVIIVLLVVIALTTAIIIAVVCYLKLRTTERSVPYEKGDLNQPTVSFEKEEEGVNFDNPIFDSTSDFSAGVLPGTEDTDEISIAFENEGIAFDDDKKLISS